MYVSSLHFGFVCIILAENIIKKVLMLVYINDTLERSAGLLKAIARLDA
jgi:hypothetical protein